MEQQPQQEQLTPEEVEFQNKLIRKFQEAKNAQNLWEEHLRERYSLGPNDSVTVDGVIQRG